MGWHLFYSVIATKDRDGMLKIIERFTPKLKKTLQDADWQEREDVLQEIELKIIEKLLSYDVGSVPGFHEFQNIIENAFSEG